LDICILNLSRISILGFRICAENFGIFHPKEPTKEYVRNFQQIMQNKAKVKIGKIGKMNLSLYSGKDYEKIHNRTLSENKPEQGQFLIILVY
jgi:hypothetical protein